jgi:hypothetical protein
MADIHVLKRRVSALEQTVEAERVATAGIDSSALHEDELIALSYGLVPVEDGERVARLLSGEAYLATRILPRLRPWVTDLDPETLEREALGDTSVRRRGRPPDAEHPSLELLRQQFAEERALLLRTGLYVAHPGDPDLALIVTARCLHRDQCYAGQWGRLEHYVEAVRMVMARALS